MIKQVPTYAKFLKDLCAIKRGLTVNKKAFLTEQVSAILQCKSPLKYKDPGSPTISVMIGGKVVEKALLDLGASVNLLPYSVYKQLRKRFWHTCATSQHRDTQFAAAKRIAKWAAKRTFCCEIGLFLRN